MAEIIKNKIQLKRGEGAPSKGLLDVGEPGYDSKNKRLYIGNGLEVDATAIPNEAYVSQKIAEAALSGSGVDLSAYATKEYVNDELKNIEDNIDIDDVVYTDEFGEDSSVAPINADSLGGIPADEYASKTFVKEEVLKIQTGGDVDLSEYATKEDLDGLTAQDVGAAPSGYGLGNSAVKYEDLNDATNCGWWVIESSTLNRPFDYGMGMTIKRYSNRFVQMAFNPYMGSVGEICVRSYNGTEWLPWEYINPIMSAGVEYRTVERYRGKVVYAMLIDCGTLPNTTSKSITTTIPATVNIISAVGCGISSSASIPFPMIGSNGTTNATFLVTGSKNISISTFSNMTSYVAHVIVKYTKD